MNKGLGRRELFDERSRNFALCDTLRQSHHKIKRPRSYTWRCNHTLDQGTEGACVGFAWAHELIARPAEIDPATISAREIYFNAQRLDPWEGGAYPGASKFYEGSSVLAGAKAAMLTGHIGGYVWAFGIDELRLGIGYYGPAVLGIDWYEGMNKPAQGFIKPTGRKLGGHAILCRAYDAKAKVYTLRNSWGSGWGIGGDCYLREEHLENLLGNRGEAVFAKWRTAASRVTE